MACGDRLTRNTPETRLLDRGLHHEDERRVRHRSARRGPSGLAGSGERGATPGGAATPTAAASFADPPRQAPTYRNPLTLTLPGGGRAASCADPFVLGGRRRHHALDVPEAAHLLGIGRTLAYELVPTNQWPTPVIRISRLIKIASGPIVELITTGVSTSQRAVS
jgi:predicted DNA-binding transcriptional regulator AlpA